MIHKCFFTDSMGSFLKTKVFRFQKKYGCKAEMLEKEPPNDAQSCDSRVSSVGSDFFNVRVSCSQIGILALFV